MKDEKESQLKTLNKAYMKSSSELKKLRGSLQAFLNEMEDLNRQFNEADMTAKAWESKLGELIGNTSEASETVDQVEKSLEAKESDETNSDEKDAIYKKTELVQPTNEILENIVEDNLESEIKKLTVVC